MNRDSKGYFMKGHKLGGHPLKFTPEKLTELAESLYEWIEKAREKEKLVLLSDWCFKNDFHPNMFAHYVDKSEDFKRAYHWAKTYQEHIVATGALTKKLDPKFSQFFLAVNHSWLLKNDQENRENKQKSSLEKLSDSVKGEVSQMDQESEPVNE